MLPFTNHALIIAPVEIQPSFKKYELYPVSHSADQLESSFLSVEFSRLFGTEDDKGDTEGLEGGNSCSEEDI